MTPLDYWLFLPFGYLLTVAIETPVLLVGLSRRHPMRRRLFAGFWLTACTYPIVVLVWTQIFDPTTQRVPYLICAETFAPAAECALFWLAFGTREEFGRWSMGRDFLAITVANLLSFGVGEWLSWAGLW